MSVAGRLVILGAAEIEEPTDKNLRPQRHASLAESPLHGGLLRRRSGLVGDRLPQEPCPVVPTSTGGERQQAV